MQALSFHFKFSSHRLLAHGICQFHGLTSQSAGQGDRRVFRVVKLKKASRRDNPSKVTLAYDLAALLFQHGGGPALDEQWDSSSALSAALVWQQLGGEKTSGAAVVAGGGEGEEGKKDKEEEEEEEEGEDGATTTLQFNIDE